MQLPGASPSKQTLVVAGNGMVGHRLVEELIERDGLDRWDVVVFAEEARPAYDRVALSSLFDGRSAADLTLGAELYDRPGVTLHLGDAIDAIDRVERVVVSASGRIQPYDALVLATGSRPFVPPLPGHDGKGCFVYRTVEDLDAIRAWAAGATSGVVIGGGLLGLEAANALRLLGLNTHVVEINPRLMPLQLDDGGGAMLREHIEALGVQVHTSMKTTAIDLNGDGRVCGVSFDGANTLPADIVVFSAGIRPNDALARAAGLEIGERGGVVVGSDCRTADQAIFAIGECASIGGRVWGLVAPGYDMAQSVALQLLGNTAEFEGREVATKLKLLGVDVASFGDALGSTPGCLSAVVTDPLERVYRRLVVAGDGKRVLGGVFVGDIDGYGDLAAMARGDLDTPENVTRLLAARPPAGAVSGPGGASLVCSCNNVSSTAICAAVAEGYCDLPALKKATRAGTSCGGCVPQVTELLRTELRRTGVAVRDDLCEHFAFSRRELFDIVRVRNISTFGELLASHGHGLGCEVCKPAVASMIASLGGGYILDGEQATLQDTNDHFLANLQKDGTYSIVPRLPGGEVTPEQLISIGEVARDFGLYSKITGGQRVDLFGATVDQLPLVWQRLIDAGLESGHAYGKALRTVKSCVGQTWCRYGVQDSTSLAVELELRYRGLRAPHKLKSAVSGCTRECAEAQSKDFGVIATERGWNLFVGGNGGAKPRHADLLAADLDRETLIRYLDRYLMFYIRTADRLERTATWLGKLDGGIDYLRSVVVDDSLGLGAELEATMARVVAGYECEWKATLESPVRVRRFRSYVREVEQPAQCSWVDICALNDLEADRGSVARVGDREIALFRIAAGDEVYAVGNVDPYSGSPVLARGIVGSAGERVKVTSPMYKQSFDLHSGRDLADESVAVETFPVRVVEGRVMIEVA